MTLVRGGSCHLRNSGWFPSNDFLCVLVRTVGTVCWGREIAIPYRSFGTVFMAACNAVGNATSSRENAQVFAYHHHHRSLLCECLFWRDGYPYSTRHDTTRLQECIPSSACGTVILFMAFGSVCFGGALFASVCRYHHCHLKNRKRCVRIVPTLCNHQSEKGSAQKLESQSYKEKHTLPSEIPKHRVLQVVVEDTATECRPERRRRR